MAKNNTHSRSKKIVNFYRIAKHFGAFVLLILILIVGSKVRLQGIPNIPSGQFASNDAFLYLSQAQTIDKDGTLPEVEIHRWVPLGRDLRETLNGYPYAIAYASKVLKIFFPDITIYQVLLYTPTICFLIGLSVLCLFLYFRFGFGPAAIVGTLLVILPGSIERSAAGFSDRDAWCWMLATIAITTYLWKEGATSKRVRYFCSVLSGFCVYLGGLSWEGFGGFVLVIVIVELWRFLTTDAEERLLEYVVWVLMFVPTLYVLSPAYHSGSGFTTHVTAFLLLPSLIMLLLRSLRYFLARGQHAVSKFVIEQMSARAVSLVFCAVCLLIGIAYFALQRETFAQSIVPFSGTAVMEDVGELRTPHDTFWYGRYGHVLLIACLCLIVGCVKIWGKKALILALLLSLFTAATFLRQYLYHVLSPVICEYLFYSAVAFTPIAALGIAALRTEPVAHEYTYVAFAFWLLFWLGLARDALRYDFFIGVPLAYFAAITIQTTTMDTTQRITEKIGDKWKKHKTTIWTLTKTVITTATILLILFWEPPGNKPLPALATRGYNTHIEPEHVIPGKNSHIANACQWIGEHLSTDKVVAAPWSYGHMLNVLGGVKTVIGPDHFILHWIDLYEQHVAAATSEHEALEFLKTHHVTHLFLSEEDVLYIASQRTHVDEMPEHPLYMVPLVPRSPFGSAHYRMVPVHKNTLIKFVEIDFHRNPVIVTARLKTGKTVKLPYIKSDNEVNLSRSDHTHDPRTAHAHVEESNDKNGGILHLFDPKTHQEAIHYLSPRSWNSLAIKLFFRDKHSEAFVPVYPKHDIASAKVKIWEIHYPSDIEENLKYLAKSPEKKDEEK